MRRRGLKILSTLHAAAAVAPNARVSQCIDPLVGPNGLLDNFGGYQPVLDALEPWARSDPHRVWWQNFLRDTGGTGFWRETYLMRGGMEAIYDDIPQRQGFASFAPLVQPRGSMFSARARARIQGDAGVRPPVEESVVCDGA